MEDIKNHSREETKKQNARNKNNYEKVRYWKIIEIEVEVVKTGPSQKILIISIIQIFLRHLSVR